MASRLDISASELCALCDYAADAAPRYLTDFMRKGLDGCLLCSDEEFDASERLSTACNMSEHLHSDAHRKKAHEYTTCMKALQLTDRQCYHGDHCPVSRRETIVVYLSDRISNSDAVHGVERFNEAAVAFLVRRMGVAGLARAFQTVYGSERMVSRAQCSVCLERPSTMMFTRCKHVCVCMTCAIRLQRRPTDGSDGEDGEATAMCPVCRVTSTTAAVYIV